MEKIIQSPLKWYDRLSEQRRFRGCDCCAKLIVFPQINTNRLPVFCFRVPLAFGAVTQLRIFNEDDIIQYNLDAYISKLYLPATSAERLVIYNGTTLFTTGDTLIAEGCFYARIRFTNGAYMYSEIFTVDRAGSSPVGAPYYLLSWGNSFDFGGVPYSSGFKHSLVIESPIKIEQLIQTEEGIEDDAKNFTPTLQQTQIQYGLKEYVSAPVAEALGQLKMHDDITVTLMDEFGMPDVVQVLHRVQVQLEYNNDRCNAVASFTFFLDDGVQKTNCNNPAITDEDAAYLPSPLVPTTSAINTGNSNGTWALSVSVQAPYAVDFVEIDGLPFNSGNTIIKVPVTNAVSINQATVGMAVLPAGLYAVNFTPVRIRNGFTTRRAPLTMTLSMP